MRNDVLLDEDNDLQEVGDEWAEGESSQQEIELMVFADKGENREFPYTGFGIERRLKSRVDERKFLRELRVELENSGFDNAKISLGKNITDFTIEV